METVQGPKKGKDEERFEDRLLEEFRIEFLGTDRVWRFHPPGDSPRLVYQMARAGTYRVGRRVIALGRRDVLVTRGGRLSGNGEGEFIHVQFPTLFLHGAPDVFARQNRRGRRPNTVAISISKRYRDAFENILIALFREQEATMPAKGAAIRARMLQLFTFLYRVREKSVPHWEQNENITALTYRNRVLHVINYVSGHYQERLSLPQLAAMAGLSRTTFCRVHKAVTGETPMQHLARIRTEQAQRMLTRTPLSVNEVALASGFDDLSTFFRTFRRRCRMSPLEFRKQFQNQHVV